MSAFDVAIVGAGAGREAATESVQTDRRPRAATRLPGADEKGED